MPAADNLPNDSIVAADKLSAIENAARATLPVFTTADAVVSLTVTTVTAANFTGAVTVLPAWQPVRPHASTTSIVTKTRKRLIKATLGVRQNSSESETQLVLRGKCI